MKDDPCMIKRIKCPFVQVLPLACLLVHTCKKVGIYCSKKKIAILYTDIVAVVKKKKGIYCTTKKKKNRYIL